MLNAREEHPTNQWLRFVDRTSTNVSNAYIVSLLESYTSITLSVISPCLLYHPVCYITLSVIGAVRALLELPVFPLLGDPHLPSPQVNMIVSLLALRIRRVFLNFMARHCELVIN